MKTKALVHLTGVPGEATLLKRLALVFDEIHYVPPQAYSFTTEALNDPNIVEKTIDGHFIITKNFNFFDHIDKEWSRVLSAEQDSKLLEVICCFREAGIISEVSESSLLSDNADQSIYKKLSRSLIGSILGDKVFERVSETEKSQYDLSRRTTLVTLSSLDEDAEPLLIPFVEPPNLITDIDYITASLLIAEKHKLSSVFHTPRHRLELDFLYEKYKIGVEYLKDEYPHLNFLSDRRLKFGELAFSITNEVVASDSLVQKSPTDILKLRNSLEAARQDFLSNGINELGGLVAGNPWSADTSVEIEKFISGKLYGEIVEYEKQSKEVWKKMYGKLSVHATATARNVILGGAALGTSTVAGLIAPGTSMWGMLGLAAVGLAKEAPKAAASMVESLNEARTMAGSSISYISKLSHF